jgi:hypothetical protein
MATATILKSGLDGCFSFWYGIIYFRNFDSNLGISNNSYRIELYVYQEKIFDVEKSYGCRPLKEK